MWTHRQKGFEWFTWTPLLVSKDLYTTLNPTVCKCSTSFAAIENHQCPNEFGCRYATCLFVEDQWMNVYDAHKHLHSCDKRMHINTCVNKSLFQALKWFTTNNEAATEQAGVKSSFWKCWKRIMHGVLVDYRHLAVVKAWCSSDIFSVFSLYYFTTHYTCCSTNSSTFFRGNSMSAGLANADMDSWKLDTILCEPCSHYCSASVPKWPQK